MKSKIILSLGSRVAESVATSINLHDYSKIAPPEVKVEPEQDNVQTETGKEVLPRRSSRTCKKPQYLSDYKCLTAEEFSGMLIDDVKKSDTNNGTKDVAPVIDKMQPALPNNNNNGRSSKKPFTCTICKSRFSTEDKLYWHTLMHPRKKEIRNGSCEDSNLTTENGKPDSNIEKETTQTSVSRLSEQPKEVPSPCKSKEVTNGSSGDINLTTENGKPDLNIGNKITQAGVNGPSEQTRKLLTPCKSKDTVVGNSVCKKTQKTECLTQLVPQNFNARPYGCRICTSRFSSSNSLYLHELMHPKVKRKNFSLKAKLKRSLKLAAIARKPFRCTFCCTRFANKEVLLFHKERLHIKPNQHLCALCHTSFKNQKSLIEHYKSHFEFVFKRKITITCQICSKTFDSMSNFKKHYSLKHESELCVTCGTRFGTQAQCQPNLPETFTVCVTCGSYLNL